MNERVKSEGQIIGEIMNDDRTKAQKVLHECKKRERSANKIPVRFGSKTIYLVPQGVNLDEWLARKKQSKENRH